jgi:hypothetical protein
MVAYTLKLLEKHWKPEYESEFMKRRGVPSPSTDGLFADMDGTNVSTDPTEITMFKSIAMELMYMSGIRIDVLKECICLAMRSHNPGPTSWKLLRQVIHYLKMNPNFVVNFGADNTELHVYCDAGYGEHADGRSHTGIYVTLGNNAGPIMVKSKKQGLVTQSSTEAEMLALTDAVKRARSIARLLVELGFNSRIKIKVSQDNTSTMQLARIGEGMGGKAKHFRVRYHFLSELINDGELVLVYCNTLNMIADFLTKPMTGVELLRQVIRAMYHDDAEEFKVANRNALCRVAAKQNK